MLFTGKDEWLPRRPATRTALGIGFALFALQFLALQPLANAQPRKTTEDEVKAAYLVNFAKLAQWPRQVLPDGRSPLVIGVSGGDNGLLDVLKTVVAGRLIGTHPLVVKPASSGKDRQSCHIVFFRASERKHIQAAIEGMPQTGVLLVGEDESFLGQGGMINLVLEHGSIRFEVNSDALDRSEIHFSSKMLAMAKTGYGSSRTMTSNLPLDATRQLERSFPPQYPAIAERMSLKGTAQVQAVVKPDGTVKEVKVLGGHPLLADALARAVMQWKYQPAARETLEVVKFSFGPQ